MDTLTSLKVFREVVERNSFSGAAKRLDMSSAMVSKHIANLEALQRTRLLNRTSRSISLTESGAFYYASCREALNVLDEAAAMLGHNNSVPSGILRLTAPQWCANQHFAKLLMNYEHAYPKVDLEVVLDNQQHDLVADNFDLALRVTPKPSATLITRPLAKIDFVLVATPGYFESAGRPASLRGLGGHSFVLPVSTEVDGLEALRKGQRDDAVGRGRTVKTNDTTLAMQLVQSGFGLAYLPRWVVQDELESGALELAIEGYTPFTRTLYAAYKNRRFLAPKIRTFIDFMAVALAEIAPTEQHADVEPPSF